MNKNGPAVIAVAGAHNSGKTTLIERLIPLFNQRGYRVGTVKRTCHEDIEVDHPGTDSRRHRNAGADTVVLMSRTKMVLTKKIKKGTGSVRQTTQRIRHDLWRKVLPVPFFRFFDSEDLILVEGGKGMRCPKVAVYREGFGGTELLSDPDVFAVYSESNLEVMPPVFSSREIDRLVELMEREIVMQTCVSKSAI